jgi:hypothetical protein
MSLAADLAPPAGAAGGGVGAALPLVQAGALSPLQQQLQRGQTHSTQHLWTGTSQV